MGLSRFDVAPRCKLVRGQGANAHAARRAVRYTLRMAVVDPPTDAAPVTRGDLRDLESRLRDAVRAEVSAPEARLLWLLIGGIGALLALFRLFDFLPAA